MNEQLYYRATHATGTLPHIVLSSRMQSPYLLAKFAIFEFKIGHLKDLRTESEEIVIIFRGGCSSWVRGLCLTHKMEIK